MWMFNELLVLCAVLFTLLSIVSFINEKYLKFQNEIGLMTISLIMTLVVAILIGNGMIDPELTSTYIFEKFNFNDFLMNGILCFMLFSGASRIKVRDLEKDSWIIAGLAVFSTLLAIFIYGSISMVLLTLIGFKIHFIESLIIGCVLAPTDPISATSILKKCGLPERITIIIEGESLFNDGIAVAIFITLKNIYTAHPSHVVSVFFETFLLEIIGGVGLGLIVGFVFFQIFKRTQIHVIEVFTSFAAVSVVYTLAEYFHVSGPISAVVVGILYASLMYGKHSDYEKHYSDFFATWDVLDQTLNGFLYILLGVSVVLLTGKHHIVIISFIAILAILISRFLSVTPIIAFYKPDKQSILSRKRMMSLMTWSGLKGGLCLALALGLVKVFDSDVYNIALISTYAVVVFSTIVQGLTIKKVYYRLISSKNSK